jgi:hypothetical protein
MRKTALALLCGLFVAGCNDAPNQSAADATGATAASPAQSAPAPSQSLEPVLDMNALMLWVLDPAADAIWESAGSIDTAEGTIDLAPTDDEGWEQLRHAGAVIAESANLLMLPGRAVDQDEWKMLSRALVDIGLRASRAAEAQDSDAMFEIGGELYEACLACHQRYWIVDPVRFGER